jgi:hypothetical protein
MFDVGAGLPATGEHQHRLHQNLAAVMGRGPLTSPRDRLRQRITNTETVRKAAKSVR